MTTQNPNRWKSAPAGTVLLKQCLTHGWIETEDEYCPVLLPPDESCGLGLDPAEPFVPLMTYVAFEEALRKLHETATQVVLQQSTEGVDDALARAESLLEGR